MSSSSTWRVVEAKAVQESSPGTKVVRAKEVDRLTSSGEVEDGVQFVRVTENFRILALGDSYTVGEGVSFGGNFPNTLKRLLLDKNNVPHFPCVEVKIVAKTGWATQHLLNGIDEDKSLQTCDAYDLVTLLIGVNNQYNALSSTEYGADFEKLLGIAIDLAGKKRKNVVVLSIPDWGVTPFAREKGRNAFHIAKQIDEFNSINLEIAKKFNVRYISVTAWTRESSKDPSLLAGDGLHPSEAEYLRWANAIVALLAKICKKTEKNKPNSDSICAFISFSTVANSLGINFW